MKRLKDLLSLPTILTLKKYELFKENMKILTEPKKYVVQRNVDTFLETIPPLYREITMKTSSAIHGHEKLKDIYAWFDSPVQNILLLGPPGTGKSSLCYAMIRYLLEKGRLQMGDFFMTSSVRLDYELLNAIKSNEGDKASFDSFHKRQILVIDDFGRENITERTNRQYFDIFDYRQIWRKPTILTSNLTFQQISSRYDPAICSRMQEWIILEFTGKDLRGSRYQI